MAFEWDKHNLACTNTWAFLRGLGQYTAVFSRAGSLSMADLKFYVEDDDAALTASARELALTLDRIFTKALFASYETGFNLATAVQEMVDIMTVADKTLTDLAESVDQIYDFQGELK